MKDIEWLLTQDSLDPQVECLVILMLSLCDIVNSTNWLAIMKKVGPEKQIEIKAEIERAIKRINKELN